jgi:predicted PurR-regulated permease PerM
MSRKRTENLLFFMVLAGFSLFTLNSTGIDKKGASVDGEAIKRKAYFMWYTLGILALLFIVFWVLSFLKHVVILLSVAILIAYVLAPMVEFFNNPIELHVRDYIRIHTFEFKIPFRKKNITLHRKGFSRITSIMIVYIILLIVGLIVVFYLLPIITLQLQNLSSNRATYMKNIVELYNNANAWITPRIPETLKGQIPDITTTLIEETRNYGIKMLQHTIPMMQSFLSYFAMMFVIPFVTFYVLMDVDKYKRGFMAVIPHDRKEEFNELLHELDLMLGRYIRGQIIVCIVIGVSVTLALVLMKIQYAVLIGVFAGFMEIIPYIGVVIGMVPAIVIALFKGPLFALFVLIVLYLIHWSEGHVIVPNVMGQSVGLPPLVVIVALIIGAETMGILGMFLAVPIASVLRVIVNHYIRRLSKSSSPTPAVTSSAEEQSAITTDPVNVPQKTAPVNETPSGPEP